MLLHYSNIFCLKIYNQIQGNRFTVTGSYCDTSSFVFPKHLWFVQGVPQQEPWLLFSMSSDFLIYDMVALKTALWPTVKRTNAVIGVSAPRWGSFHGHANFFTIAIFFLSLYNFNRYRFCFIIRLFKFKKSLLYKTVFRKIII